MSNSSRSVGSASDIHVSLTVPQQYKLGDPTQPTTNLGPVVSVASAEKIRKQVADAGMSFDVRNVNLFASALQ